MVWLWTVADVRSTTTTSGQADHQGRVPQRRLRLQLLGAEDERLSGIVVVMMPNGGTYWYFSDNNQFSTYSAIQEANKLKTQC